MGPLVDTENDPQGVDFMKILSNPKVMELA
jgi:hypothetical protein